MSSIITNKREIGINETVSILGVSTATIRNWVRHNYLTPLKSPNRNLQFNYHEVSDLKNRIQNGELSRLVNRANKRNSSQCFLPDEYVDDNNAAGFINHILALKQQYNLSDVEVLFALSINLFEIKKLLHVNKPSSRDGISFKTATIENEFNWWFESIKSDKWDWYKAFDIEYPNANDILGLVYQSLKQEGSKAQEGSYYTPSPIVSEIVEDYVKEDSMVLDPCCGTGQFLLSAAKHVKNPENLWGFDIDEIAVRIARLNVILQYPKHRFEPNIFHTNTLLENQHSQNIVPQFDAVITNPPWGVHFSLSEIQQLHKFYPSITSKESFSFFLLKGLEYLKGNGVLSFLLPESILNIKIHQDIRQVIIDNAQITKIKYLNRPFKKVFTSVIRLDVRKNIDTKNNNHFDAIKGDQVHSVNQTRLKDNPYFIFDVFSGENDLSIFDKVYAKQHVTLKDNADWALGIVTGDNKKYVLNHQPKQSEPIITGKDVKRFLTKKAQNYVVFEPDKFQQVAPKTKYRVQEKLLYKFISKDLIFAYDDKQRLTLNSANILIPKIPDYPIKTILALFNSTVYQFIYQKKFGAIKVLRGDLEKLPLPILSQAQYKEISRLLTPLLDHSTPNAERIKQFDELNTYIMSDIFNLTLKEQEYIHSQVSFSSSSLSI